LREARGKADLTQTEVAELSGTDQSYIGKIERGLLFPTVDTIFRLAAAIGVDFKYLLLGSEPGSITIGHAKIMLDSIKASLRDHPDDQSIDIETLRKAFAGVLRELKRASKASPRAK
jgi:transcriptional regulator with XRE-family HTH domain